MRRSSSAAQARRASRSRLPDLLDGLVEILPGAGDQAGHLLAEIGRLAVRARHGAQRAPVLVEPLLDLFDLSGQRHGQLLGGGLEASFTPPETKGDLTGGGKTGREEEAGQQDRGGPDGRRRESISFHDAPPWLLQDRRPAPRDRR